MAQVKGILQVTGGLKGLAGYASVKILIKEDM